MSIGVIILAFEIRGFESYIINQKIESWQQRGEGHDNLQDPPNFTAPILQLNEVFLIASGDMRLSTNQTCWPAQAEMERLLSAAFAAEGITVRRAHPYDETLKHGFIWNQRMGMDVFKSIPPEAPLIVAVAV